jgi:hypothetical protein
MRFAFAIVASLLSGAVAESFMKERVRAYTEAGKRLGLGK